MSDLKEYKSSDEYKSGIKNTIKDLLIAHYSYLNSSDLMELALFTFDRMRDKRKSECTKYSVDLTEDAMKEIALAPIK